MSTYLHVARYHLLQRLNYLILPWALLTFVFLLNVVIIVTFANTSQGHNWVGGLGALFILFLVLGVQSVSQSLPFGLTLGISRRSYFIGTLLLAAAMSAVYAVVVTGLQAIERATGGWGIHMYFFRVPYILNGPWYLTLLTSWVFLTLIFVYGMWYGLMFRRWKIAGLVAFIAAEATVLLLGALLTTWTHGWSSVGHFFHVLSATGLSGLVIVLVLALAAGGFATMRRMPV
jgi:hypothetical protein